jgi:hypothetical protein
MNHNAANNQYFYNLLKRIAHDPGNSTKLNSSGISRETAAVNYDTREGSTEFYKGKTLASLNYSLSETFFTTNFSKELKKILKSPEIFNKASIKDKNKVQQRLDNLSVREYEWKIYHKKGKRDASLNEISVHFRSNFEKFEEQMGTYMHPEKPLLRRTQRSYMNYFTFKFQKFIEHVIPGLGLKVLEPLVLKLTKDDYDNIVRDYLPIHSIFNDLMTLVLKKAHDSLFASDVRKEIYHDNALVVTLDSLRYEYHKLFSMSLINAVLNYCNDNKILEIDIEEVSKPIYYKIYYKTHLFNYVEAKSNGWGLHCDNCEIILSAFEESGVYTEVVNETRQNPMTKKVQSRRKGVLPHILESYVLRPLRVPNIRTPGRVKTDDVDFLIKPVIFGEGSTTKSKSLVDALSYSRMKRYRISESFLQLALLFQKAKPGDFLYNLIKSTGVRPSFPTNVDIDHQKQQFNSAQQRSKANLLQVYVAVAMKNEFIGEHSLSLKSYFKTLRLSQVSELQSISYLYQEKEKETLNGLVMDKKFAYTSIQLAQHFVGYPLYVTDTLCIRLRMYPKEHWISRTSGGIKHLLCDYTAKKITLRGLINLLFAYYKASPEATGEYEKFLSGTILSKKRGKADLYSFFHNNYLNFVTISEPLYFMNLHMELLKIEKSNFTSVNIEIDQSSSGVVFLAFLTRSRSMAEACGLLSKQDKSPYLFLMNQCGAFLNGMDNQSEKARLFLTTNKKVHKYALMCYTYNQSHLGRMNDFHSRWLDENKVYPTEKESSTLNEFALKYEDFIESVFPNTARKLELIREAVEISVRDSGAVSIRTLDGEVLNWTFYEYKTKKRSRFDPADNSTKTYSVKLREGRNFQPDITTHKRKFLSYLIHSIDAAVLRYFITEMKEKYNTNINHLHDCVILHPNNVDDFYDLVDALYTDGSLLKIADELVFEQLSSSVSRSAQNEIEELKLEFDALCDGFENEITFDPRNLYKFES